MSLTNYLLPIDLYPSVYLCLRIIVFTFYQSSSFSIPLLTELKGVTRWKPSQILGVLRESCVHN